MTNKSKMSDLTTQENIQKSTSEVALLNPEQKEALGLIDKESAALGNAQSVVELVGVLAGIKPVALIRADECVTPDLIEATGLSCVDIEDGHLAVSSDSELARQFKEDFIYQRGEDQFFTDEGHRRIGKMLGYPETATDYFLKRWESMDTDDELPMVVSKSLKGTPTDYFHHFILSPDNYQQEIDEYVKPLESAVKLLAPDTYKIIETFTERNLKIETRRIGLARKMGRLIKPLFGLKLKQDEDEIKHIYVD